MSWEAVIGLEVHVQLRTRTKLFCGCAVSYGEPPNHDTCPVCLALPGALPVLNASAVEHAVRAGLAMGCGIAERSLYARKNYFYPDLPKGYQISQYEEPLAVGGHLDVLLDDGEVRRVGITRIHMEEDAGKSVHEGSLDGADVTCVDLDRAGVPLAEIVSEPDLRSAEEAGAYLRSLRQLLRYLGVTDGDLEKGHFRCDVNVSLRRPGETRLGTRAELKNLNSFRAVEAAVTAEVARQADLLEGGGEVVQETLRFDMDSGRIRAMRSKENADDYRYFPDPDLIPLTLSEARIEELRGTLPELPAARRARFEREHGLSEYEARLLTESRALAELFEEAARRHGAPRSVANFVLRDVLAALKDAGREVEQTSLEPAALADLVAMLDAGRVTARSARELLPVLLAGGGDPEALVRERGLEAVSDAAALGPFVDAVLAEHDKAVQSYRGGDAKALNFLMGQVMRRTGGKADAATVRELLLARLGEG